MWIIYSFLSGFLVTSRDILGKKFSQRTDEYVTAFAIQFFGFLLFLPIVLLVGIPEIKPMFWWALLGSAVTIPLGNILYMRAVKLSPLSVVVPLMAFNPFFTTLIAFFVEGKLPNLLGWIGVILVVIGLYLLRLNKEILKQGWLAPLKQIKNEPGSIAMLGVTLVWALGASIGKLKVVNSSALFSTFTGSVVGSIILFFILLLRFKLKFKPVVKMLQKNVFGFSSLGVGIGLSNLTMYAALAQGFTPYVISIKRINILISALAGKIFFKEKLSKSKILGICLMFAGLVLMIVS